MKQACIRPPRARHSARVSPSIHPALIVRDQYGQWHYGKYTVTASDSIQWHDWRRNSPPFLSSSASAWRGDAAIKQKCPVSGRSVNPARLMASDKMHASVSLSSNKSVSPNNRDAASTQQTEKAPKNGKLGRRKEGSQRGTKRLSALITAVPIAAGHRGIW